MKVKKSFDWSFFVLGLITGITITASWFNMMPVNADMVVESFTIPSEKMLDDSLMFWEINGIEPRGSNPSGGYQDALEETSPLVTPDFPVDKCIFLRAEEKYGVHHQTLQSLWHKESKEGKEMGSHPPGKVMDKRQFDAYKKICKRLGINLSSRRVSRTGDMGHVQFQPITWLAYGVDGNGDGKIDPWNLEDAVMSAANYLSVLNYQKSPWTALSKYNGGNKSARSRQAQQYAGNVLRNAIKKGAPIKL
jgi:hypothetical protein